MNEEPGWTHDAAQALRFARREDAEAYIADIGWTETVEERDYLKWFASDGPAQGVNGEKILRLLRDFDRLLASQSSPADAVAAERTSIVAWLRNGTWGQTLNYKTLDQRRGFMAQLADAIERRDDRLKTERIGE